jgi:hypothetical protein
MLAILFGVAVLLPQGLRIFNAACADIITNRSLARIADGETVGIKVDLSLVLTEEELAELGRIGAIDIIANGRRKQELLAGKARPDERA